jgi:DNA processing protein
VVSGLARGIDGAAHAGALETGTIAVVAGGIDHIYPPEHADLHNAIAERGLVISERPLGRIPTARDFPRRNRLISGLSRGTVVVEAALRSGSLITARFAAEQGREVMAVPGSPIDPRARGSNQLLRDGAHLVETVEDVTGILAGLQSLPQVREAGTGSADDLLDEDWPDTLTGEVPTETPDSGEDDVNKERYVRGLVSPTPVSVDEIARQSGLPAGTVSAMLMEMELTGEVVRLPGGLIQRVATAR